MKHIPDEMYRQIIQLMPIPCVDLVVKNQKQEILLLKRINAPAKDEWWFPGGRIHYMETRQDAVMRKLKEECGIVGKVIKEVGTYDVFLEADNKVPSHGITSVFEVLTEQDNVIMDKQSNTYAWKSGSDWLKIVNSKFIMMIIRKFNEV
jgi:colanic acid biosynthesis protein WcaH